MPASKGSSFPLRSPGTGAFFLGYTAEGSARFPAGLLTTLALGSSGQLLRTNIAGNAPEWVTLDLSPTTPQSFDGAYCHFEKAQLSAAITASQSAYEWYLEGYKVSIFGSGAQVSFNSTDATMGMGPGIAIVATGTNGAGFCNVNTGNSSWALLTGRSLTHAARVAVETLSTSGDQYRVESGLGTHSEDLSASLNSFGFRYSHDVNGGKWLCVNRLSNTETVTDSGVTVAINTPYSLRAELNAAKTETKFYINNALVATHTTGNPGNGSNLLNSTTSIRKLTGTTSRRVHVDYIRNYYA